MKLQTQISLVKKTPAIDYNSKLFLLGSCFAENIAGKFSYYKFQNKVNPLGVLFHPLAILDLLKRSQNRIDYSEKDLFFSNGYWQSYSAHSRLNNASQIEIMSDLNSAVHSTKTQLMAASHVVLTFGTAWVYTHIKSQRIVANCHKQPHKEFEKSILSIDKLNETFESIISILKSFNPEVTIIFTISPVRHLKDGFVENNHDEFLEMVTQVRSLEKAIGVNDYKLSSRVLKNKQFARSLFVVDNVKIGDLITKDNVRSIRPGNGLHPKYYKEILGKKFNENIYRGEPLTLKMIE